MKNLSKYIITTISVFIILTLPIIAMAQGDPGGDPGVPIDGGATLILAAGIGYGAKKLKDAREKKNKEVE